MNWLTVKNLSDNKPRTAKLLIDGIIGGYDWLDDSGTTSAEFIRTVEALGELDDIQVDVNSPGGVVSDGIAITNYLRNHKASVGMNVIGEASSIASVITQSASPGRLHMATGTFMLVHDPLTGFVGDAEEFRQVADYLDKLRDGMVSLYKSRNTKKTANQIKALMQADTLLTADDAVRNGFADTTDAALKAVACADRRAVMSKARAATRAGLAGLKAAPDYKAMWSTAVQRHARLRK